MSGSVCHDCGNEVHCGTIHFCTHWKEIERLRKKLAEANGLWLSARKELAKALAEGSAQSELIQREWGSPFVMHGLRSEIERLREKLRIESDEAMTQKARADHLQKELAEARATASYQVAVEWRDKCRKAEAELAELRQVCLWTPIEQTENVAKKPNDDKLHGSD
jgi:hypothetical protein